MKKLYLSFAALLLCGSLFSQGFLNAIKKGIESTTGIKTSNETVFIYPTVGEWKMSLVQCRGNKNSGNVAIVFSVTRLLAVDLKNQPCVWSAYSINGESEKRGNKNPSLEPCYDFMSGTTVRVALQLLPGVPKEAESIDLDFQIFGQRFEVRRIPVEWGVYETVEVDDPSKRKIVGVVTDTVPTTKTVSKYIPPRSGSKTVSISKTVPRYKLETGEKYVLVECSKEVDRIRNTRQTILETTAVVEENFVYGHMIDIEVIEKNFPYTAFFYIQNAGAEIIDLSKGKLDEEQQEYSLFFTSKYAKSFPFYEAIKPVSQMFMALGDVTVGGNKGYMAAENAPPEVKSLIADFFDKTHYGYIVATEGKMDTEERNLKARSMLQQNYLRFFDDCLRIEFPDDEMGDRLVKFEKNYTFDIDGRKIPMTQASSEVSDIFDYLIENPETESGYPFAGDASAKKYSFEYRFYDENLMTFGMFFTPLTLRFDLLTFYDEKSDATFFACFYSMGYDKVMLQQWPQGGFEGLQKDIKANIGFDIGDYLLSPLDLMVEKAFVTFRAVTVDVDEFLEYSLSVGEYITMHDIIVTETEKVKVDCSWFEKQKSSKWVKHYITVTEKRKVPTVIPGKWVKEVEHGVEIAITGYITVPGKMERRIWRPDYVTFGRGEKENIAPATPKAAPKPAEVKKADVEFDKAPVLSASSVPYVALQEFAPTDIAEDARYVYLIARAGYDDHSLLAIEKESGKIKKVKSAPADKSSHYPRKVMRDGSGRVLVEIAGTGVFLCNGFDEPTPTKLQLYTGDQWNNLINSELMGAMPDGNIMVYRGHQDVVIQDRTGGDVKAQTDKLKYAPSNEYKKLLAILPGGDILRCYDQYAQGKVERLSGLAGGNAALSVSDVKTLLGDKYRKVQRIVTTPSGAVVAISDYGVHRSTDGGKSWKSVNKDNYDHTLIDLAIDSKENVHVIYQKSYGNYELRVYSPDLSKGILSTKIESQIPIVKQGATLTDKFAGVGSEPKMIFIDSAGNLWILGGGKEYTQDLLIFNPAGIKGFPELTGKKSVVMKEYF